jgi:hypothetical protein
MHGITLHFVAGQGKRYGLCIDGAARAAYIPASLRWTGDGSAETCFISLY